MERNLDRRIELLFPVTDGELQARLLGVMELGLADDTNSWVLGHDPLDTGADDRGGERAAAPSGSRDRARRRREPETLGATT